MDNRLWYMNFAICCGKEEQIIKLEEIIETFGKKQGLQIQVETMKSGAELRDRILEGKMYDVICMEIRLPDTDGIELARTIRETDEESVFLFMDQEETRIKEIFEIMPAAYLGMPVEKEELCNWIMKSLERMTDERRYFVFNFNRKTYHIPYKQILYLESGNHRIKLQTEKQAYCLYDKLDQAEKSLTAAGGMFLRIHKSYIVNYWHIRWMDGSSVKVTNGEILPVSDSCREGLRKGYRLYTEKTKERLHGNAQ